jgi:hypothetical protein
MNEALLIELEQLLAQPVGSNFHKFRSIYTRVFNIPAPGCKCRGNQIYNELKDWYILEKNKITNTETK